MRIQVTFTVYNFRIHVHACILHNTGFNYKLHTTLKHNKDYTN